MELFSFFRKSGSSACLGVDLGTTSVKVVEAHRGTSAPSLVNYGLLEFRGHLLQGSRALQSSSMKLFDSDATEALKIILGKMKPRTTNVVATIPVFSVFTTVVALPEMSRKELESAMVYQAKQYIPLPLSEVAVDWTEVGGYEDEKGVKHQNILLISVPQDVIRKYKNIFFGLKLDLKALEVESFALARAAVGADPTPSILIDIGSRSTSIVFVEKGHVIYHSQTDHASSSLTQAVAASLSISPFRAEDLKKERGIATGGINFELSTIMMPFLDVIINEVKRAQFSCSSLIPKAAKAERVVLAGGGANLIGIEEYFGRQFGIPAVKAAPLGGFSCPAAAQPFIKELNPVLAVAAGATMREIE